MQLFINSKEVVLDENATFQYYEDSFLFSDASGFSLDITLPLKGCKQNRDVFGRIETILPTSAKWPASLVAGNWRREGMALLTAVAPAAVTVQFIAGKNELDEDSAFDTKYINQLSLPSNYIMDFTKFRPTQLMQNYDYQLTSAFQVSFPNHSGADIKNYVRTPGIVIPWINAEEDSHQNRVYGSGNDMLYTEEIMACGLSWMPFLLPIAKSVCSAIGYKCDFSEWEASDLRNLVICNALPPVARNRWEYRFEEALPHWTVKEFFDNISPALSAVFEVDRLNKKVTFHDAATAVSNRPTVKLDKVDDEFDIDSSFGMDEADGSYLTSKPFRYADSGHDIWKFMDCPWYPATITSFRKKEYATMAEALKDMEKYRGRKDWHWRIYYAKDLNVWLCFYNQVLFFSDSSISNSFEPRVLNVFGPEEIKKGLYEDDMEYRELKVLPVVIPYDTVYLNPESADDGVAMYLNGVNPEEQITLSESTSLTLPEDTTTDEFLASAYQTQPIDDIENGEPDTVEGHYSLLFLGYWPGFSSADATPFAPQTCGFRLRNFDIVKDEKFSMRLNTPETCPYANLPKIDESVKYTYRFYSAEIPDVNAEYNIRGHRYVCKRLEVEFTARGRSHCIKGEFYRIPKE